MRSQSCGWGCVQAFYGTRPLPEPGTHIFTIKPDIDLLHKLGQNHLTIDDLIKWVDVMARVNYLWVATFADLTSNVLVVYQKSFDALIKEMTVNPVTYTKERFAIIKCTMLDNRKIDPDNIEFPSTLQGGHLSAGDIDDGTTFYKQIIFQWQVFFPREETARKN